MGVAGVLREILKVYDIIKSPDSFYLPCSENTLHVPSDNPRTTFNNLDRTALFVYNLQFHIKYEM